MQWTRHGKDGASPLISVLGRQTGGATTVSSKRFFVIIWRANAILILVTAVLACAVLAYAAWQIYREATRTRQATGVMNVAAEEIDRSKLQLGGFEAIAGTDVLRAPLQLQQVYGFSSGSKEAMSVENYLFYNSANGSSRWLVPGNKGLFLSARELPEREYSKPEQPVVAVVYELVEADTTGDGKLTTNDAKTVAISDSIGSRFTRVLSGVEEINATTLTKSGHVLVLYTAGSTLKAAEIDVDSHRTVRDAPLQTVAGREPDTRAAQQ
jgi:hypothetical protein